MSLFAAALLALSAATVAAGISTAVLRWLLVRRWLSRRRAPAQQRWGESDKPHSGGAAFTICAVVAGGAAAALFGLEPGFAGVLLAVLLASGFGVVDEVLTLPPAAKLLLQLVVVGALLWSVGPLAVGAPMASLWLLAVLNALNLFDNTDGAAATVALVATAGLACAAALAGRLDHLLLCGGYIGSLASFLAYNRYPSRLFMGDIGSFQLAAFLGGSTLDLLWAGDAGVLSAPELLLQDSLPFLVIFLDVALVCAYRISQRRSPLRGDTNHLAHLLIEQAPRPRRWMVGLGLLIAALAGARLLLAHGDLSDSARTATLLCAWLLPSAALGAAYLRGLRARQRSAGRHREAT